MSYFVFSFHVSFLTRLPKSVLHLRAIVLFSYWICDRFSTKAYFAFIRLSPFIYVNEKLKPTLPMLFSSFFPFWAAGAKGPMTYAFIHRGNFCFFFSFSICPPCLGSNPSLETQIPAFRLKNQPKGLNPSLKAQIPARRVKSNYSGSNPSLEVPSLLSIGHRSLWGCCPSYHNTSI